ncbi:MAG: hypothetical protein MI974_16545 [Chitinophagales bacterium]|nr:hypothetical protein [Chitinophagales bacterium]
MIESNYSKKGIIEGATLLKNGDGLHKLFVKSEGRKFYVVSYLNGKCTSSELKGREVMITNDLRPIRLWGEDPGEILYGTINGGLLSVFLLIK